MAHAPHGILWTSPSKKGLSSWVMDNTRIFGLLLLQKHGHFCAYFPWNALLFLSNYTPDGGFSERIFQKSVAHGLYSHTPSFPGVLQVHKLFD
jgi:hypothetical protein